MKKMFLVAVAVLMLAPASAQLRQPTKPTVSFPALVRGKPQVQMQDMQMHEPGTPLPQAPRRASSNEVYYKRPAGAFPGFAAMDAGSHEFLGYYQFTTLHVKPYVPYTYRGIANGTFVGEPYFSWEVNYINPVNGYEDVITIDGEQEVSVVYRDSFLNVPILHVNDDLDSYTYQMSANIYSDDGSNEPVYILSWPSWEQAVEDEIELLKSSSDFSYITGIDNTSYSAYPFVCYYGTTPYGSNDFGWWFGKNNGYNGKHIDGIAQAFEKPEHPYLLKEVVLCVCHLSITAPVDMQCRIYRINDVPDYQDSTSVFLPEEPGELIAVGSATATPYLSSDYDQLIAFSLSSPPDDNSPWLVEAPKPITIDDAILVVIDGYNDPEMSALADFSALIGVENHVDDGYGERAYLKVGKDDAEGNFDGHYEWQGLNNFFTVGEMKTGFSIFVTTDQPFLLSNYASDDYEYTFPAAGGVMEKILTDEDGTEVTVRSMEIASWTPIADGEWSISCNGDNVPSWLNIDLSDGDKDYIVNATVTAQPLPQGLDYREAVVRFAIPGEYMDYKFIQSRQGGEEPDTTIQEKTPMPAIETELADEAVIITATGAGTLHLYLDGVESDNPATVTRGETDETVVATATAQEEGKTMSDTATLEVQIPALETEPSEDYTLTLNDVTAMAGDTIVMAVAMHNKESVTAFQTDILLPEGFELAEENGQFAVSLSDRKSQDHICGTRKLSSGVIRVLCVSPTSQNFNGNDGDILYMTVCVPEDASGEYPVKLLNTVLTLGSYVNCYLPDTSAVITVESTQPPVMRGDVNGDGMVNIADVTTLIDYLLGNEVQNFNSNNADVNGNGLLSIADVTALIDYLLGVEPSMTPVGSCTITDYTWFDTPTVAENVPIMNVAGTNIYRIVSPLYYLYDGKEDDPDRSDFEFNLEDDGTITVSNGTNLNWWGYWGYYNADKYGNYCYVERDGNSYTVNQLLSYNDNLYVGCVFTFVWDKAP